MNKSVNQSLLWKHDDESGACPFVYLSPTQCSRKTGTGILNFIILHLL